MVAAGADFGKENQRVGTGTHDLGTKTDLGIEQDVSQVALVASLPAMGRILATVIGARNQVPPVRK